MPPQWLYSKDIIPTLLSCLGPEHSWVVQTAAGDFIKAIITISANASQNEQQCIGPNELTRQLVSRPCADRLIGYMLDGGNPLTVGVGIVIEVIRKNNSDYDPEMGTETNTVPSSRDPIYLGTLLRLFAQNVPKFMSLVMDGPTQKKKLVSTFGHNLEPLGFDRFKTCELMAELLHCSNMGLLNEVGSEQVIAVRDAERHRLRAEGKLGPQHEEDPELDDLTMRIPQSAPDEGRRLEVTNADDDGFEEVEPSKEMSEDTSHEFVQAEHDIAPALPLTSILEKDEDDFVDEPLSSPRLAVGADKISEQQFDEPDLVVAPLSPSKPKPAEPALSPKSASPEMPKEVESVPSSSSELETKEDSSKGDSTIPSVVLTPTPEQVESKAEPTGSAPDVSTSMAEREISPHPEDTPAPLFSAPPAPESGADRPPQAAETAAEGSTAQSSAKSPATQTEGTSSLEPVVGDFLKNQFVEHRVVPTILVRLKTYLPSPPSNVDSHFSFHTHGTISFITWFTTLYNKFSTVLWIEDTIRHLLCLCLTLQASPRPSSTASKPATSPRPRRRPAWVTWATSPSLLRRWSSSPSDTPRSSFQTPCSTK